MTSRTTRRIRLSGREFLDAGLNLTDNPLIVPPNEMVEAVNILVGSSPARKKRPGSEYFNTDGADELATYPVNPKNGGLGADPIIGLYEFWRYDSVTGLPKSTLMVRQGTKIWGINLRTGAATDLTGALTLPAGGTVTFQTFEGRVYWTGTGIAGVPEGYYYWDGAAASAVAAAATPPDGVPTYILSHGGRMFAWGVPGFPYRLYYSEFFDAEVWATNPFGTTGTAVQAGSLDLDPFGDPVGINGGVSFQDRLYVFMRRASFELAGSTINDFFVKTISRQIGCIGHHTIVPIANDVIYASERGILRLSSTDKAIQSEYGFISRPISTLWNTLINRNLFEQYSASYDEEENLYLLSVPSTGVSTNDTILAFNAQNSVWSGTWTGHKARTLATYIISGRTMVVSGREDGVISVLGSNIRNDLGVNYSSRFKTGVIFPGQEIDIEHLWKHVTLLTAASGNSSVVLNAYVDSRLVLSQNINLVAGTDVLGSSFILGQSLLGGGIFIPHTAGLKGQGYGLQLEVIFNSEVEVEVLGFMVEAVPAGSPTRGGST